MSAVARRTLAPLAAVTAAAFLFALLLVLVRPQWAPLESADHGAAARLNSLIAGHATAVSVVKAVTWLGSGGVLWTLVGLAVVALAIRRRWRLAIYLLVTGAGELTLDPVLKALVGRLRADWAVTAACHTCATRRQSGVSRGHSGVTRQSIIKVWIAERLEHDSTAA
jgi:undecaprenyl-diphosphatase